MLYGMKALLYTLILAALCACGGGDPEPDCVINAQTNTTKEQVQWRERCEFHP
jgi:hypothetical protein